MKSVQYAAIAAALVAQASANFGLPGSVAAEAPYSASAGGAEWSGFGGGWGSLAPSASSAWSSYTSAHPSGPASTDWASFTSKYGITGAPTGAWGGIPTDSAGWGNGQPGFGPGEGGPFGGDWGSGPFASGSWTNGPWTSWWGTGACPPVTWSGWTTNTQWSTWTGCSAKTTSTSVYTTTISGSAVTTTGYGYQIAQAQQSGSSSSSNAASSRYTVAGGAAAVGLLAVIAVL